MQRLFNPIILISFPLALACNSKVDPSDEFHIIARNTLDEMKEAWVGLQLKNYEYEASKGCFCDPFATGPYKLVFRNGLLDTAYYVGQVSGIDSLLLHDYALILENAKPFYMEAIFNSVRSDLTMAPFEFSISYDRTYSFPDTYYVDFESGLADDEYSLAVTNFMVIE